MLRLHDELMGVGDACRLLHLLLGGPVYTERYVVEERVVEEYGLLVDVADELAQVVYAEVLHVYAVDEHLALLHVVVARYEIHERRLAASALPYERHGGALGYGEADVAQHPRLTVAERHVAELYVVLKRRYVPWVRALGYGVAGLEYLVYTLHGGEALGDVVARLGKVFQGVDDAVQHHEVVYEHRAVEHFLAEHEHSAEPQHDDYHQRAEKLAHRMRQLLPHIHAHELLAVCGVHTVEACIHLLLGAERLDDAQSAERLLHLTHGIAPQVLRFLGVLLQLTAHGSHHPAEQGHEEQREQRELPRYGHERSEVADDEYGVLEEHVERRHYGVFYLLHVARHTRYDVALALLREEAERQLCYLGVQLVAYVAHHTSAHGYHYGRRQEVGTRLEQRHQGQKQTYDEQCGGGADGIYEAAHVVVGVVLEHFLGTGAAPCHEMRGRGGPVCPEENLQDGYYRHEGEYVEHRRQYVEQHREHEVLLVWRHEPPEHFDKFFHVSKYAESVLYKSLLPIIYVRDYYSIRQKSLFYTSGIIIPYVRNHYSIR